MQITSLSPTACYRPPSALRQPAAPQTATDVTVEERSLLLGGQQRSFRAPARRTATYGERAELLQPAGESAYSVLA